MKKLENSIYILTAESKTLMHNADYKVHGDEKLKRDIWQFTTINHLSWADIFFFYIFVIINKVFLEFS